MEVDIPFLHESYEWFESQRKSLQGGLIFVNGFCEVHLLTSPDRVDFDATDSNGRFWAIYQKTWLFKVYMGMKYYPVR